LNQADANECVARTRTDSADHEPSARARRRL